MNSETFCLVPDAKFYPDSYNVLSFFDKYLNGTWSLILFVALSLILTGIQAVMFLNFFKGRK